MKVCPNCGEMLLDSIKICPVCGYEFEKKKNKKIKKNVKRKQTKRSEATKLLEKTTKGKEILDRAKRSMEKIAKPMLFEENEKFSVRGKVGIEANYRNIIPAGLYELLDIIRIKIRSKVYDEITVKVYAEISGITEKYENSFKLARFEEKKIDIKLPFKRGIFKQLNERRRGLLKYGVIVDGEENWTKSEEVEILPYRDINWEDGYEYIAAWVTPTEKLIEGKLLRDAVDEIEKLTGMEGGAIDGYGGGADNTIFQLWGIYNALKKYKIRYISTPGETFEGVQRIRLPKEVIEEKSGNCIEIAVTFASALEAAEMYPLILVLPGHAMPGVIMPWEYITEIMDGLYEEDEKMETILDGIKEVKKVGNKIIFPYVEIKDKKVGENYAIIPIETTLIPSHDFWYAAYTGMEEVNKFKDVKFVPSSDEIDWWNKQSIRKENELIVVDIPSARKIGIHPMDVWLG